MEKVLVAYFSASGTTKRVAEKLAKASSGDLFEIEPTQEYTNEDLNWMNKNSRSTVEMADRNCRPEIKNKTDISKYDYIFVGFPVWWYREPSIIDTFMESYDFVGKTIIPFATSGGSNLGETPNNMQNLAPKAKVLSGKRFSTNVSENKLIDWLKSIIG
ncbi:MAG TPA: flavodoxin [Clostridiales bacterium]|nr:flavodoxin [Clostridiales bacterium]